MNIIKSLSALATITAALFVSSCSKNDQKAEPVKSTVNEQKYVVGGPYHIVTHQDVISKIPNHQPIDYTKPGARIPLINYHYSSIEAPLLDYGTHGGAEGANLIHYFDINHDEELDYDELYDFFNVLHDDGDGKMSLTEHYASTRAFPYYPIYIKGDILPSNASEPTENIKNTSSRVINIRNSGIIKEGNIPIRWINQVLDELISEEKISCTKEEVNKELELKLKLLGGSFKYLETDEKFIKAAEHTVLRRKAVFFLSENTNEKWINRILNPS